jgi:2-iminobutanoate/2-iminopropanoate deaminase
MKKILVLLPVFAATMVFGQTTSTPNKTNMEQEPKIVRFVNPGSVGQPSGFTNVVEIDLGTSRMLMIAGQCAFDKNWNMVGKGDFALQAEQVFKNIKDMIEEMGGKMEHIVRLTNYFLNMGDLKTFIQVRNRFVNTKNPPAAVCVEVNKLFVEGLLLEVEATVIIPKKP